MDWVNGTMGIMEGRTSKVRLPISKKKPRAEAARVGLTLDLISSGVVVLRFLKMRVPMKTIMNAGNKRAIFQAG